MSIKSDKWIIDQSENHQLISPFEATQIRELNGEKIVSYGVSAMDMMSGALMNLRFLQILTQP